MVRARDISCGTSQTRTVFQLRVLCSPAVNRTGEAGAKRKGGKRDEDSEPCGCYLVMHGSVIATIQPAYKRGSVSIPLADLRFIAPRWIADSQILRFALINDSY